MAKAQGLGERTCSRCKERIKVDALICRHCGAEFSPEEVNVAVKASKKKGKFAAFGCLGLVLAVGSCVAIIGNEGKPAVPAKPTATAKADAVKFYKSIMGSMANCDASAEKLGNAGRGSDAVSMYRAASGMEAVCFDTYHKVDAIEVPVSVGKEAYEMLAKARDGCSSAALNRWSGARAIKESLDGNGGVGKLVEIRETADNMMAGAMMCSSGMAIGTATIGVLGKDRK